MTTSLNHCHHGDCRDIMRRLIEEGVRVNCIITSPPYWGLRDYGVVGQLGQEPTLAEFIANMTGVFNLCHQLLADDGTLWLNMGDSYAANRGCQVASTLMNGDTTNRAQKGTGRGMKAADIGLKPKDLCGQPWRLAFALQDAGWYLRQDIIWHKVNAMPESTRDRCTKAHEYLFLLTKSERYFFDQEAIKEPVSSSWNADNAKAPDGWDTGKGGHGSYHREGREKGRSGNKARQPGSARRCPEDTGSHVCGSVPWEGDTRNKRSVWSIPTQSYKEAHFATFPEALVEPCVLAGSRPGDIVFDPFMGSGTVAQVSQRLGRHWLGAELNPEYISLQHKRTCQPSLMLGELL